MKINWGTGIVIAFGLFMTFILSFVFRVQSNPEYDNELVTENYYQKDTKYGEEMQKIQNGLSFPKPMLQSLPEGFRLTFSDSITSQLTQGKVSLYRPSGKNLDFQAPLSLSGSTLLIPDSRLAGGLWDITLEAKVSGVPVIWRYKIYR